MKCVYSNNNSGNWGNLLGGKPVSVPFCLSQIPLGLAWDLTPDLRGERLWNDKAPFAIITWLIWVWVKMNEIRLDEIWCVFRVEVIYADIYGFVETEIGQHKVLCPPKFGKIQLKVFFFFWGGGGIRLCVTGSKDSDVLKAVSSNYLLTHRHTAGERDPQLHSSKAPALTKLKHMKCWKVWCLDRLCAHPFYCIIPWTVLLILLLLVVVLVEAVVVYQQQQ
jgi:hypothetical protein